jgi:hypothetical protein
LGQEADPTFMKAALRIIETRWQAGDLTPDALADRMVEVAIQCAGDERALDEALTLVADTDGGILLASLRDVLAARIAAGSPDPATAALARRLPAARSGS